MYKILIVDDELVFRRGIHAILQKSDFCIGKIAEAVDGCQAMEILLHDTYDIVITDIRMPRMDGPYALQEHKGTENAPCDRDSLRLR